MQRYFHCAVRVPATTRAPRSTGPTPPPPRLAAHFIPPRCTGLRAQRRCAQRRAPCMGPCRRSRRATACASRARSSCCPGRCVRVRVWEGAGGVGRRPLWGACTCMRVRRERARVAACASTCVHRWISGTRGRPVLARERAPATRVRRGLGSTGGLTPRERARQAGWLAGWAGWAPPTGSCGGRRRSAGARRSQHGPSAPDVHRNGGLAPHDLHAEGWERQCYGHDGGLECHCLAPCADAHPPACTT